MEEEEARCYPLEEEVEALVSHWEQLLLELALHSAFP